MASTVATLTIRPPIPTALGQRIQPDIGIGTAGERLVPEGRNGGIQLLGQVRDLGFGDPLDAQGPDEIIHPTGRDPSQVALGHHGNQGPFGPPSRLQEPVGVVTAPAQLGDGRSMVPTRLSQRRVR